MTTKLVGIASKARSDRKLQFTSVAHLMTPGFLKETWHQMNRKGGCGVDEITTREFERDLWQHCERLSAEILSGRYKAPPVRRVNIPKSPGKTRTLGVPTVSDRLVQRSVARILEAIYEADFLDFSYGFRPGRSPHQALRELRKQLMAGKANYVFETDIRAFFDRLDHRWLQRMLRLRLGDPRILRLISGWLKAGALVDGVVVRREEGSPQGGPISPILANVYLHYVLDLWFERRAQKGCRKSARMLRFADDLVVLFEDRTDADICRRAIETRLRDFDLEMAAEKTRLIPFGRFAQCRHQGQKLDSFDFLGFTHVNGVDRKGRYCVLQLPTTKALRKFREAVKAYLTKARHTSPYAQQRQLSSMLRGFYQYFNQPTARHKLFLMLREVTRLWVKALRRRSQRHRLSWSYVLGRPWFNLPWLTSASMQLRLQM
jgi:RNA-directed DNA polymerase